MKRTNKLVIGGVAIESNFAIGASENLEGS
mgnify:CR=1 FL=1